MISLKVLSNIAMKNNKSLTANAINLTKEEGFKLP